MNGDKLAFGAVALLAVAGAASRKGSRSGGLKWLDESPTHEGASTVRWKAVTHHGTYVFTRNRPNNLGSLRYEYRVTVLGLDEVVDGVHSSDLEHYPVFYWWPLGARWGHEEAHDIQFQRFLSSSQGGVSLGDAKKIAGAHHLERRGIRSLTKTKGSRSVLRWVVQDKNGVTYGIHGTVVEDHLVVQGEATTSHGDYAWLDGPGMRRSDGELLYTPKRLVGKADPLGPRRVRVVSVYGEEVVGRPNTFAEVKKMADAHHLERRGIRSLTKTKGSRSVLEWNLHEPGYQELAVAFTHHGKYALNNMGTGPDHFGWLEYESADGNYFWSTTGWADLETVRGSALCPDAGGFREVKLTFEEAKKIADAHHLESRGIRGIAKPRGSSADARYPSSARRDRRIKLWSPQEATEVARAVSRRLKRTTVWGEKQLRRVDAFLLASEQRMNEINLELLWKYFAPEMRFWKRGGTPSLRGKPKYADAPDGAWGNYEDVIRRVGGFGTWGDDGGFGQRELVLRSLVHARAQDGLRPHPGAPLPEDGGWFENTYFQSPLVQEKSRLREARSTVLSTQYDLRQSVGINPRTGERR